VFSKKSRGTTNNNPIGEQPAATRGAVARQYTLHSPTTRLTANFENAQIGNKPASTNQSSVSKNEIREKLANLEREINSLKRKVQKGTKRSAKKGQYSVSMSNQLNEYKIQHYDELQKLRSSKKSVANPNPVGTHEANNDAAKSLPHQQNHEGASKEKKGSVLGRFGNFISRVVSGKFINNHMSKSSLEKKINALTEVQKECIEHRKTINDIATGSETLKIINLGKSVKLDVHSDLGRELSGMQAMINKTVSKCSELIPESPELHPQKYSSSNDAIDHLNKISEIIGNKIKTLQSELSSRQQPI